MSEIITVCTIIFCFFLIGCIRPHVIISMKKYMDIYVKVLFVKFRVSTSRKYDPPDEELDLPKKKKPVKKKKPKKEKPKKEKKPKKEAPPKPVDTNKPQKQGKSAILELLGMVKNILVQLFSRFRRYLRVRVNNFYIVVATEDAATTAITYGAVCGYGDTIFRILESALDFKVEKGARVGADCNYLTDEMQMDIDLDISITVGQVFKILFSIIGAALAGVIRFLIASKKNSGKQSFVSKILHRLKEVLAPSKVLKVLVTVFIALTVGLVRFLIRKLREHRFNPRG